MERPLRVEQRKELLLPVVFLCGEKDAAKVVAAKGRGERERGVKAVQSFSWDNPLMHVMQQVQAAVRRIWIDGRGCNFLGNFGAKVCKEIRKFETILGQPVFLLRGRGEGGPREARPKINEDREDRLRPSFFVRRRHRD